MSQLSSLSDAQGVVGKKIYVNLFFRIGWTQDQEMSHLSRDLVLHRFENSLDSNQGRLSSIYNVDQESLIVNCKSFFVAPA